MANEHVAWLEDLGSGDVARVGGKNASPGEMIRNLKDQGVRVPDGFATTACGWHSASSSSRSPAWSP